MLRDFDPEKDKRFNSTTTLNYNCKSRLKICLIGTMNHIEAAQGVDIETVNLDDLKKFNKEAKLIKKWARKFDILLVSESLSRNVTKLIGRYVTSIGKLPVPISENENPKDKVEELMKTIRFRVKKFPWLA
jgi:large subunit ribosomal protein L10Ae